LRGDEARWCDYFIGGFNGVEIGGTIDGVYIALDGPYINKGWDKGA
jgi:hypothetical protein